MLWPEVVGDDGGDSWCLIRRVGVDDAMFDAVSCDR